MVEVLVSTVRGAASTVEVRISTVELLVSTVRGSASTVEAPGINGRKRTIND